MQELIQQIWCGDRESAFVISSQMMLMLLVIGPHFEWQASWPVFTLKALSGVGVHT